MQGDTIYRFVTQGAETARSRILRNAIVAAIVITVGISYGVALAAMPQESPVAAFTFSPSYPSVGTAVSFDGSASSCFATPCTYRWTDDKDGSLLGTGVRMSFTFRGNGTKYVRLTITDGTNAKASVEHDVIVSPKPPSWSIVPAFGYSPSSPVAGSPVQFDGSSSVCTATPCSYSWTDDADGSQLGNGAQMAFTFKGTGTKYVRLTISDAQAHSASVEHDVIVAPAPPSWSVVPAFGYSPSSPVTGSPVQFDASSSVCTATPCSYGWTDVANGSQLGTGAQMAFTFNTAGTKSVLLTVTDAQAHSASVQHDVIVGLSWSVVPAFSFSPSAPVTGSPVQFDGSSSVCTATPCSYSWADAASGSQLGTGAQMAFTFNTAGTKTIRLTVTDAQAHSASVEHDVTVATPPPSWSVVPTFQYSPGSPVTGSPVAFDGTSSVCSATPCSYRWTDDADGSQLGTGAQMAFTFKGQGTKYVRLTITDAQAHSASVEHDVLVTSTTSSPSWSVVPAFNYSPSSPVTGSPVAFDASSSVCTMTPCSYSWTDDADGSQLGTGAQMSFTFKSSGTKSIRLTITDAQAHIAGVSQDVIVSAPPTQPSVSGAFYVSTAGSDLNAGTSTSPWRTIQKAANTMSAGNTVIVAAGTYAERVTVTKSGSSGSPIIYQAQGTVVMQGFNIQASYIAVYGFEITNTPGTSPLDRSGGSAFYVSGNLNDISANYIHHTTAAGIYLTSSATNTTVGNNRIAYGVECGIYIQGTGNLIVSNDISHTRSVSGSDADGIRFFGSGNIVRKNYIHDLMSSDSPGESPHLDAFQTWGPATNYIFEGNLNDKHPNQQQGFIIEGKYQPTGNIIIRNNVFIARTTGYQPAVNAGGLGVVTNMTIVNNTMVAMNGAAEYAIRLQANLQGAVVKNNAVYDHGNSSNPYIRVEAGATNLDIGFNSVSKSNGLAPAGSPYPGDLWMVDPMFVNFAGCDFHLQPASPLANRGATLSDVTNDYDEVFRPQSNLYDIGAFEFIP